MKAIAVPSSRFEVALYYASQLLLCAAGAWLGIQILVSALPASPLLLRVKQSATVVRVLRQGWSFFTRDPREPQFHPYRRDGSQLVPLLAEPQRAAGNLFGLDRASRVELRLLTKLASSIPDSQWSECTSALDICLGQLPVTVKREASDAEHRFGLCGEFVLVRQAPPSWADAHFRAQGAASARAVGALIYCKGGERLRAVG